MPCVLLPLPPFSPSSSPFSLDMLLFSLSPLFSILPFLLCVSAFGASLLQAVNGEAACWVHLEGKNKEVGLEFHLGAFSIPRSWSTETSGWAQADLKLGVFTFWHISRCVIHFRKSYINFFYGKKINSDILCIFKWLYYFPLSHTLPHMAERVLCVYQILFHFLLPRHIEGLYFPPFLELSGSHVTELRPVEIKQT